MKKLIAVLIGFALLSTGYGLNYTIEDNYRVEGEIRDFKISKDSVFVLKNQALFDLENPDIRYETSDQLSSEFDFTSDYLVTGTRLGNGKIAIINRSDGSEKNINIPFWAGSVSVFQQDNTTRFIGSAVAGSEFYFYNGTRFASLDNLYGAKHFSEKTFDYRDKKGFIIEADGSSSGKVYAVTSEGDMIWQSDHFTQTWPDTDFNNNFTVIMSKGSVTIRNTTSGEIISSFDDISAAETHLSEVYISSNDVLWRYQRNKELEKVFHTEYKIRSLEFIDNSRLLLVGDNIIQVLDTDSEKVLFSEEFEEIGDYYIGDHTGDGNKDIGIFDGTNISVYTGTQREETVSLNNTFYGSTNSILRFIAENTSVMVGGDRELFSRYSSDLRKASNLRPETSKELYYVPNRTRGIYITALAARDNASITFDREKADAYFTNRSLEELQEMFIEEYRPNHVVKADLSSIDGLSAALMAVKSGVMPVENISRGFDMIGVNRNIAEDGRYISLLEGGEYMKDRSLLEDEIYLSTVNRGDLDGDGYLEASVGIYPEDASLTSVMFNRSIHRDKGKNAMAAGSYLRTTWPGILATAGGGMMQSKRISSTMDSLGYDVQRFVEHRVDVVDFLLSLTPSSIQAFMTDLDSLEDKLAELLSESIASLVSDAMMFVKALSFAEQSLEVYLEHDWATYSFQPDRGLERISEMDIPEGDNAREVIENTVMKALYALVFPEKHPAMTEGHLRSGLRTSDMVFYSGRSNATSWILPDNSSGYSGENHVTRSPELGDPVIVDASDSAGSPASTLRKDFLANGATSFLGFSSSSYAPYSIELVEKFLKYGDTVGGSSRISVNMFRTSGGVLADIPSRKTMENSMVLWGNPETLKDPVRPDFEKFNSSCGDGKCQASVKADLSEMEADGSVFTPGEPAASIYRFEGPGRDSELIDFNYSLETSELERNGTSVYDTSGEIINSSEGIESTVHFDGNTSQLLVSDVTPGGRRVESIDAEFSYSAPALVEIQDDGFWINTSESFRAVIYTSNSSRTLELDRGGNWFPEEAMEVRVFRNGFLTAEDERVPVRETAFVTQNSEGSTGELALIAENRGNSTAERSYSPEIGDGAVLAPGEERKRDVTLEPGESRSIGWKLTSYSTDNTRISIGGKELNLSNSESRSSTSVFDPERFVRELEGWRTSIDFSSSHDSSRLTWTYEDVKIRITESPDELRDVYVTPRLRMEKTVTPGDVSYRVNRRMMKPEEIDPERLEKFQESISRGKEIFRRMKAEHGRRSGTE